MKSSPYPRGVFPILFLEFCERFAFYGTKAILTLYMTRALLLPDNTATSVYHGYVAACYVTPILGGLIADGGLGKYRTIVYFALLYIVGYACQTISAIKFDGSYTTWVTYIALIILAIGSGVIKPCKSALGGDQFNEDQEQLKEGFFSWFYMAINVGSLISMMLTPILRSNVSCFDDIECYSLAFGIPAAFMTVGYITFVAATPLYKKLPAQESALPRMCGCVLTALKSRGCCAKNESPKDHWLDYADNKYEKSFIEDVKDVLKVLWLFLPLPIFWALFDQQGDFVVEPDQLQVANALFVVLLIPVLEGIIFPCTLKLNIMTKPLQRMGVGMFLAAVAFVVAGGLQVAVDNSEPAGIESGMAKVKFINTAQCDVQFSVPGFDDVQLGYNQDSRTYLTHAGNESVEIQYTCQTTATRQLHLMNFEEEQVHIIISSQEGEQVFVKSFPSPKTTRTQKGQSTIRIINTLDEDVDVDLKSKKENDPKELRNISSRGHSEFIELISDDYAATLLTETEDIPIGKVISKNGAVYTLVLHENATEVIMTQFEDVGPNTINIFWQIPQYFIISLGECLFSVTGLAFAYTQAPASMKSVLTAAWLLTVGVGNIVVIIISEGGSQLGQMEEFFLFAGLMLFTVLLFAIMAYYYEYVEPRDYEDDYYPEMTEKSTDKAHTDVPISGSPQQIDPSTTQL